MLQLLNERRLKLLALLSFFILNGELLAQSRGVPRWFLKPPVHSKSYYYGAGISNVTYDTTEGLNRAKRYAANEIVKSIRVELRAGVADVSSGRGIETAFFVVEEYDSLLVERIIENALVIKNMVYKNNNYVLICVDSDFNKPKKSFIHSALVKYNAIKKKAQVPGWIQNSPVRKGFIYGISKTEPYESVEESWENSSKIARYRIASQLNTNSNTLIRKYDSNSANIIEMLTENTVDLILSNTIIKERWYDPATHHYCTLIEYQITD